jgi:DNA-binding MarR family transcriptional regulator
VSVTVDRLETLKLVKRSMSGRDGRIVLVNLTERGRDAIGAATDALNKELFGAFPISGPDLSLLFRLLQPLRYEAGDFASEKMVDSGDDS